MKKRKRSETARPQFWFWIKIRVNPIYLVIFFMVAPPNRHHQELRECTKPFDKARDVQHNKKSKRSVMILLEKIKAARV